MAIAPRRLVGSELDVLCARGPTTRAALYSRKPLAGSNNTALSRLKAKGMTWPGRTSASERMRAVTSLPPSCVTTKVSEPAGSTISTLASSISMARALRSAPSRIGDRLGPDAEDQLLAHRQRARRDRRRRVAATSRRPPRSSSLRTMRPFSVAARAVIRFIAGEPMKSATNRLAGLL